MKSILLYLMVVVYMIAGVNHFINPKFYIRIIPDYMPTPQFLNYASGLIEIVLGSLLLFQKWQRLAAWGIVVLLMLFFLVHIYMLQQSYKQEHYYITPTAAWLRLLLQPVLILWALWYTR